MKPAVVVSIGGCDGIAALVIVLGAFLVLAGFRIASLGMAPVRADSARG